MLRTLTGGDFHILIVNGADGLESVLDRDWPLPGIASLGIPNRAGMRRAGIIFWTVYICCRDYKQTII